MRVGVTAAQIDRDHDKHGVYYAEASALEFAPAHWPETVAVAGLTESGDVIVFEREEAVTHGGEFAGFIYGTADGMKRLTVFND